MAGDRVSFDKLSEYDSLMRTDTNILKRNTDYVEGNIVNKGQVFLKCTQSGKTKATTLSLSGILVGDTLADGTAEWEVISINGIPQDGGGSGLGDWKLNHSYKENDIFVSEHQIYKALVGFTSGSTFENIDILEDYTLAGETPVLWTEGQEITTNDIVEYDGNYYKALVDFTCGKEFSKTAFEEYVPKSLTDEEVKEVINSYNPEFSGGTGGENYSTEEQRIGTWIDGKPLYQKTLVKTGGVSTGVSYFSDELHNINYLQKISASFTTNANRYESEYINDGSDKLQTLVYVMSNNVGAVYTLFAHRTVSEMYVTVQYTKTTD